MSIGISDHALVRWLNRTGAMDLEPLRAMLAESLDRACAAASHLDVAEFLVLADGLVFVVRNKVVVTVLPDEGRHTAHAQMLRGRNSK